LFLLNEIDLLEPSTAAGLNGILDGQPLCIPENCGELITPHPMFRFCATANTNGGSDETGLYQGTLRKNLAFMDRFFLCEVSYPVPKAEEQLLEKTFPNAGSWWNMPMKSVVCSWVKIPYQPLAKQNIQAVCPTLWIGGWAFVLVVRVDPCCMSLPNAFSPCGEDNRKNNT
jgi:hypothetical protein